MRLKELRKLHNLTLKDISDKLQVPLTTYNSYELAKAIPGYQFLIKVAKFYDVSLDYLLEHETPSQLDFKILNNDKKQAIYTLLALNQTNFIKAHSYINGLYATQN